MRKSVSTRYFTTTAFLLLGSLILLGSSFMIFAMRYFKEDNDNKLLGMVDKVVSLLEVDPDSYDPLSRTEMILVGIDVMSGVSGADLFVTDTHGDVIITSSNSEHITTKTKIDLKVLNNVWTDGYSVDLGTLNGVYSSKYYIASKPYYINNDLKGFVFASSNADSLTRYMGNVFSTFFIAAGIMLLVSSIFSVVLTDKMTTPLKRISHAAQNFGKGNFDIRVPVEGDDEIATLAQTFNTMANSVAQMEISRRSFMGDVAHELRTPMTTIKGFVDGMLDGTIPPESYKHYLGIVSSEAGRLTRLTQNMLDITKVEAGEYNPKPVTYDIWETLTNVMFSVEKRFESGNIGVEGFNPMRILVKADPDMMYQVVFNIVDNAIKFTPKGGKLTLSVVAANGKITVGIKNTGEGISEDKLTKIFDRFYKADTSRGLNSMGNGLGMHISKVLVNRNGGELWVNSKLGEWTEFKFTLPMGEAEKPLRGNKNNKKF